MYRIINGILDLERIQSGTLALEECVIEDLLGRAVVDLADQARAKGLTLELEIKEKLPAVMGDAQQLSQAFANLVDNAVKFTPPGGRVCVRAQASRKLVCIDVTDTGIGIPAEDQPRVFDRFYRGRHQGVVHTTGSGLGLSLVKAIIDNHRGDIELVSTSGKGTSVYVRLPALTEADN